MTGATTFYDKKANFYFEGTDESYSNAFINEVYEIAGYILNEETHTYIDFKEQTRTLEEANIFFDQMKTKYPLSKINIYRKTWQQFRYYG